MEIIEITAQQSHTLMCTFGTNAKWDYLEEHFSLDNISKKIQKNLNLIGNLFMEFVLNEEIEDEKQKIKDKVFLSGEAIRLTNTVLRIIAENTQWEKINFKSNQIQNRIIRNPVGAGKAFTKFLVRIMTDQELGLV